MDTRYSPVRRSPAAIASYRPAAPRLACVRPVASVHPEPGSNSPLYKSILRPRATSAEAVFDCARMPNVSIHPNRTGMAPPLSGMAGGGRRSRCLQHGTMPNNGEGPAVPPLCLHVTLSKKGSPRGRPCQGAKLPESGCKGRKKIRTEETLTHFFTTKHESFPDSLQNNE